MKTITNPTKDVDVEEEDVKRYKNSNCKSYSNDDDDDDTEGKGDMNLIENKYKLPPRMLKMRGFVKDIRILFAVHSVMMMMMMIAKEI